MRTALLALAALTAACHGLPSYTCEYGFEAGGMTFCLEYEPDVLPDKQLIEGLVEVVEREVSAVYPSVRGVRDMLAAAGTFVVVVDRATALMKDCEEIATSGTYVCKTKLGGYVWLQQSFIMMKKYTRPQCVANWILAHELLHMVDYYMLGENMRHSRPRLFDPENKTSIEYKIRLALGTELSC